MIVPTAGSIGIDTRHPIHWVVAVQSRLPLGSWLDASCPLLRGNQQERRYSSRRHNSRFPLPASLFASRDGGRQTSGFASEIHAQSTLLCSQHRRCRRNRLSLHLHYLCFDYRSCSPRCRYSISSSHDSPSTSVCTCFEFSPEGAGVSTASSSFCV
jgi:hypothetical protein